jgi:hypothetical protein
MTELKSRHFEFPVTPGKTEYRRYSFQIDVSSEANKFAGDEVRAEAHSPSAAHDSREPISRKASAHFLPRFPRPRWTTSFATGHKVKLFVIESIDFRIWHQHGSHAADCTLTVTQP